MSSSILNAATANFIIVFFVLTIITIHLRWSLYVRLGDIRKGLSNTGRETVSPFVQVVKESYCSVSKQVEDVNTIALIENFYHRESLRWVIFRPSLDTVELITKFVPNLLIAGGLGGTFLGITNNLSSISGTIRNFSSANTSSLLGNLNGSLQHMGTAFITSLVGLSLGSLLAFINILLGTGALKSRLFACLEDYLDNVYKPTIEGHSRLDRLLEKLTDRQEEFLRSFEENISKTLQKAIFDAGAFLQTENKKIFDHAETSYNKFAIAVQKIDSSANLFKEVSESLNTQNQTLTESLSEFKSGIRNFKTTGDKLEKNNVFQSLEKILVDLSITQSSFANSAAVMENSLPSILDGNQQATQLAQSIYLSWGNSTTEMLEAAGKIAAGAQAFDISATSLTHQTESLSQIVPRFCVGIDNFTAASTAIKENNIIKDLMNVVSDLQSTQQSFTDSAKVLETGLTTLIGANQTATQLAQEVYHGWQDYTLKAANATEVIATGALAFQKSALSAQEQSQAFGELIPQFKTGVNDFVKAATKVQKSNIIQDLDKVIVNLSSTQDLFAKSSQVLAAGVEGIIASNQQVNHVASRIGQNLSESTDKIHASANALVSAARSVENNSLAVDLNMIVGDWKTIQSEFSTATTSLSQTYTTVEPAIKRIEPITASIVVLVDEVREFSKEVATLNQTTLKSIESEAANRKQFSYDVHEFMRTSNSMDREMLKRLLTAIENLNSAIKPTVLTPKDSSHN